MATIAGNGNESLSLFDKIFVFLVVFLVLLGLPGLVLYFNFPSFFKCNIPRIIVMVLPLIILCLAICDHIFAASGNTKLFKPWNEIKRHYLEIRLKRLEKRIDFFENKRSFYIYNLGEHEYNCRLGELLEVRTYLEEKIRFLMCRIS